MNLERSAERAVIGAILLEPSRYGEVREWLQVDDFDGTAERAAYEAMAMIDSQGDVVSPDSVNQYLLEQADEAHAMADGPFLVDCMQACPRAERASTYGRMVLESSIRRRISSAATQLRQRAEKATTAADLNLVFNGVDRARRGTEELHQREARAQGALSPTPVHAEGLPSVAIDRATDDSGLEIKTVTALVDNPDALDDVTEWLDVDDFADAGARVVYGELRGMHKAHEPIDRLTVEWALAQDGFERPSTEEPIWVSGKPNTRREDATGLGRRVLEASVRATIIATTGELERPARRGHPSTAVAYNRLNALWTDQRRLVRASRPGANRPSHEV